MGKTPMSLVWSQNILQFTNRPVLILTPLAVGRQMVTEGEKFDVGVTRLRHGAAVTGAGIYVANYETLHLLDPNDFAAVVCDECFAGDDRLGGLNVRREEAVVVVESDSRAQL